MKRIKIKRGDLRLPVVTKHEPIGGILEDDYEDYRDYDPSAEIPTPPFHLPPPNATPNDPDAPQPLTATPLDQVSWVRAVINGERVWLDFRINDIRVHACRVNLGLQTVHGRTVRIEMNPIVFLISRSGTMTLHMLSDNGRYLKRLSYSNLVVNGDTMNFNALSFDIG